MIITKIKRKSNRRYKLFVDDNEFGEFDIEVISLLGAKQGLECDEVFLENLQTEEDRRRAKERALYLLEYRDHSKKELIDKLCRSYSKEISQEIADKMEQLGFLDDAKYAKKLAKRQLLQKKLGKPRAVYELCLKGIPKELAQEAVENIETDPIEQIYELFAKKYPDAIEDIKVEKRAVAAAARRGYGYSDIRVALKLLKEENNNY